MLSPWNRASKAIPKALHSSHRARTSRTRAGATRCRRSIFTSEYASTPEPSPLLRLLAIFGAGSLASMAVYAVIDDKMVVQAETEESAPAAVSSAIISNLTKDTAYIVGESVMTGKLDDDAMLVPHQLLFNGKPKHVAIGENEGWVIDANGKLHSWNQSQKTSIFSPLSGYAFKQVACGSDGFIALLQTNGSVWIRFSKDQAFTLINKGDLRRKTVSKLAVGANHVAALTTDGCMYTLGSNNRGQCGIVELKESPLENPHLVSHPSKFVDLATGLYHTVGITQEGQVIAFGYNKNLQLGKPQEWVQYSPPSIPMIPFGSYNEVRSSEQQRFAAKNWNDTTEYITQYAHSVPAVVEYFSRNGIKASRVVCGDEFTLVLDSNGKLHGFGDGGKGQLARKPARSFTPPTHIYRDPFGTGDASFITSLSCGSDHCMAVTKTGEIWAWGANVNGECGRKNRVFSPVPTKLDIQSSHPIADVICSKNASIFVL